MQAIANENGNAHYMLTVIDVFSKYALVVPVKNKDASTITAAFNEVLAKAKPRRPERLQTDKGVEFFNVPFSRLMKKTWNYPLCKPE